jgi:hypothetical protein
VSSSADQIARRREEAALQTLGLVALDLAGAAARDAPIDEGTLRGAATTSIEETESGAIAVVSFPLPYAARQEEEESFEHPRGGKAHYLGDALKARAPHYRAALEAADRRAMRGARRRGRRR